VLGDALLQRTRNWRKPGKLRQSYDAGVFPPMSAMHGTAHPPCFAVTRVRLQRAPRNEGPTRPVARLARSGCLGTHGSRPASMLARTDP
jgi:hypothetical protein